MGLRGFFVLAAKIWSFVCYIFKRQVRAVSFQFQLLTCCGGLSLSLTAALVAVLLSADT